MHPNRHFLQHADTIMKIILWLQVYFWWKFFIFTVVYTRIGIKYSCLKIWRNDWKIKYIKMKLAFQICFIFKNVFICWIIVVYSLSIWFFPLISYKCFLCHCCHKYSLSTTTLCNGHYNIHSTPTPIYEGYIDHIV